MARTTENKILLKTTSGYDVLEALSSSTGVLTPGIFVEYDSDSKVKKHSAQGGTAMVVLENRAVGGGIDETYSTGQTTYFYATRPGDIINAFVPASAAAIVVGDYLVFDGDGHLIKGDRNANLTAATYSTSSINTAIKNNQIVAIAKTAINNSSGTSKARITVQMV
jgi:hypothetical protein